MDATEQLLLSEGVCRRLGIVAYHPEIQLERRRILLYSPAREPTVRVELVKSVSLLPLQSALVPVQLIGGATKGPLLMESTNLIKE